MDVSAGQGNRPKARPATLSPGTASAEIAQEDAAHGIAVGHGEAEFSFPGWCALWWCDGLTATSEEGQGEQRGLKVSAQHIRVYGCERSGTSGRLLAATRASMMWSLEFVLRKGGDACADHSARLGYQDPACDEALPHFGSREVERELERVG